MSIRNSKFFDISDSEIIKLSSIEEIGSISWSRIYGEFSSLKKFLALPDSAVRKFLTEKQTYVLRESRKEIKLPKQIKLVKITDTDYPELLREIPDPPLWLFAVGDVSALSKPSLAVVGSRKNTAYANEAIKCLLNKSILNNVTIISGLAYGIDKLAHMASLDARGATVAVLAGGLDKIYPAAHRGLAKDILKNKGALISEYPPGSPAVAYKFPVRNRIISGLSHATIVVEATIKSGTMTTAKSAIEQSRELMAVPGDINKKSSEGCNYLIAQGATPLIYPEQLMNFFNLKKESRGFDLEDEANVNLQTQQLVSGDVGKLIEDNSTLTIDQLIKLTGLSAEAVLHELTVLELSGKIYQDKPGYYSASK